jgi:hypothetical protein
VEEPKPLVSPSAPALGRVALPLEESALFTADLHFSDNLDRWGVNYWRPRIVDLRESPIGEKIMDRTATCGVSAFVRDSSHWQCRENKCHTGRLW